MDSERCCGILLGMGCYEGVDGWDDGRLGLNIDDGLWTMRFRCVYGCCF